MSVEMEVRVVSDSGMLAREAGTLVTGIIRSAIEQRGVCRLALAGGSTPALLYERLAAATGIDWPNVEIFFGDERHVPPDHKDSNYRMARETLLARVPLPEARVHRMRGELADAEGIAAEYEQTIRDVFGIAPEDWPRFDLVLLGMGNDGHTASLFPHTIVLEERSHLVAAVRVDKLRAWRVTLTLPVLLRARHTLVLVSGHDKADTLHAVLEGPRDPRRMPIQFLVPDDTTSESSARGRAGASRRYLTWMVDAAAASALRTPSAE